MIFAGLVIMAAGIPFDIFHRSTRLGAAFQTLPWNILFAGIVALLLALQKPVFSSLWTAPLRFLGYISYGLYLYHLIIYFSVYDVLVRQIGSASLRTPFRVRLPASSSQERCLSSSRGSHAGILRSTSCA